MIIKMEKYTDYFYNSFKNLLLNQQIQIQIINENELKSNTEYILRSFSGNNDDLLNEYEKRKNIGDIYAYEIYENIDDNISDYSIEIIKLWLPHVHQNDIMRNYYDLYEKLGDIFRDTFIIIT